MSEQSTGSETFSLGEKVQFIVVRQSGSGFNMKTMTGVIVEFSKPNGIKARIKYHGGNYTWRKLDSLTKASGPSPLNAMFGLGKQLTEKQTTPAQQ